MSDNVVLEIKDRLNIADIISGYLPLKKAGVNFRGLCPFHNEKTPSFNVNLQKQIWHCFGCGEGGDVFGFVMRYENLEFKDALKLLAQKAGVELPEYKPANPQFQEEKDWLYRINTFSAKLYHQVLLKNKEAENALKYLKNRGLNLETIKQWQIGFAPNSFNYSHNALLKKKISSEIMVKAGVIVKGEKQNYYDRFRGRITFPIFDQFGQVLGFSARILPELDDGKTGKYINSPETLIYQKSKILFGLNFAKDIIRKTKEVIIVEGQMDLVASHQAGVSNVVASSGTALTLEQLSILRRLAETFKFCFDTDQAGQTALKRAVEIALPLNVNLKVIELHNVKDPDDLIKKNPKSWQETISSAVSFFDYFIKQQFKNFKGSVEEKKYIANEVVSLLVKIPDPVEQDHYIIQLAKSLGSDDKALRQLIKNKNQFLKKAVNSLEAEKIINISTQKNLSLVSTEEKEVLGGILVKPEFYKSIEVDLEAEDFENLEIREYIVKLKATGNSLEIMNTSLAKEAMFVVESLLEEQGEKAVLKRLLKSYSLLKIKHLKKKQKTLQNKISQIEIIGNKEDVFKLQTEFAKISQTMFVWEKKV